MQRERINLYLLMICVVQIFVQHRLQFLQNRFLKRLLHTAESNDIIEAQPFENVRNILAKYETFV